jgi:hypothetical protein
MEEILASIRRIIADDDSGKAVAKTPEAAPANPPPPAPKPVPPPVAASPRPAPPQPSRPATPLPSPPLGANKPNDPASVFGSSEPKPVAKPATPPPAADVLDLTEQMAAPTFRTIDAASDVVFAERAPEVPGEPARATLPPAAPDYGLISGSTRAAVDNAFNSLAHTVLGNNARTLEDLVKEMLRPMLKSWLDDNLPGLVERIVRAEIERVSRGR